MLQVNSVKSIGDCDSSHYKMPGGNPCYPGSKQHALSQCTWTCVFLLKFLEHAPAFSEISKLRCDSPIPVHPQRQFSDLLVKEAGDYGALSASIADLQWSNNFKHPPAVWGKISNYRWS